jgi:hypothetical protein
MARGHALNGNHEQKSVGHAEKRPEKQ